MSYVVYVGPTQANGERWIRAVYSDAQGEVATRTWSVPDGIDYNAVAAERESKVFNRLAVQEFWKMIFDDLAPPARFSTTQEMVARLRQEYKDSTENVTMAIAGWIINRLNAGDFTAAQLRSAFGMDQSQWDNFSAKLQEYATCLNTVKVATGE